MRGSQIWAFVRLISAEWKRGVTGPPSAILFVVGLAIGTAGVLGIELPAPRVTLPLSWSVAVATGFRSAYRVWLGEHEKCNTAEAKLAKIYQRREQQIEITLAGFGLAVDVNGPVRQTTLIAVINRTDRRLDDCRLQIAVITRSGRVYAGNVRFSVSDQFSLLVDETKHRPILAFDFGKTRPDLLVPIFDEINGRWAKREEGVVLTPGDYEIVVEGLSSHTKMERLTLSAKCEGDQWEIKTATIS
jgi:hypothetical protein